MSTNVVNLDALLPREDMAVLDTSSSSILDSISIPHLNGFVFAPDLRKPHFQRETNQWTPSKIAELVAAFLDLDLIPAVILWRAGKFIFVVDGAHRLSALLAWIHNDYGDGARSLPYFGGTIPEEQRRVAEKTRKLIEKEVGSYVMYETAQKTSTPVADKFAKRLINLSASRLIAQWVPTNDPHSAEASFFKINQASTQIDPVEKKILKARRAPSAVAARAITNSGSGHKYWSAFGKVIQAQIEEIAKDIYGSLYAPPITSTPLNTLDVPVAGRGYNALPFIFDLVNESNGILIYDTKNGIKDEPPVDETGENTLAYLKAVKRKVEWITTDQPQSLGLHPVVYFYTRGGQFKPEAFFAASRFVESLEKAGDLHKFAKFRREFEEFIIAHREASALIVHRFGAAFRSISWIQKYYERVLEMCASDLKSADIQEKLKSDQEFSFLTTPPPPPKPPGKKGGNFSQNTKTAAFFDNALEGGTRCALCEAHVHKNSMQIDHKTKKSEGGHAGLGNAQVAHPWCNSTLKG